MPNPFEDIRMHRIAGNEILTHNGSEVHKKDETDTEISFSTGNNDDTYGDGYSFSSNPPEMTDAEKKALGKDIIKLFNGRTLKNVTSDCEKSQGTAVKRAEDGTEYRKYSNGIILVYDKDGKPQYAVNPETKKAEPYKLYSYTGTPGAQDSAGASS